MPSPLPSASKSDSAVAALRAELKALRAEKAELLQSEKAKLRELGTSQQETLLTVCHDAYVSGITDAMAIYQKHTDAAKKQQLSSEQAIADATLARLSPKKKTRATKTTKKAVTKQRKAAKQLPVQDEVAAPAA